MAADHVLVGRIVGLYGIKGWLKLESYTYPKENIGLYRPWYLGWANREQRLACIEPDIVKVYAKGLIVKFAAVDDRDVARGYLQTNIFIRREQLPELVEGEYYWHDLQNLRVLNRFDVEVGKVAYLIETGSNDVLAVRQPSGKEILIPYIKGDVVTEVDLKNGVIRVDWDVDN